MNGGEEEETLVRVLQKRAVAADQDGRLKKNSLGWLMVLSGSNLFNKLVLADQNLAKKPQIL